MKHWIRALISVVFGALGAALPVVFFWRFPLTDRPGFLQYTVSAFALPGGLLAAVVVPTQRHTQPPEVLIALGGNFVFYTVLAWLLLGVPRRLRNRVEPKP